MNIKHNRPKVFSLIFGIILSVIIYYINYISNLINTNLMGIIDILKDDKYHIIGAVLDGINYKEMEIVGKTHH